MNDARDLPHFVRVSPLDQERFGIPTVKVDDMSAGSVTELVESCKKSGFGLAIVRCPTRDIRRIHELLRSGFTLMDTLLTWRCPMPSPHVPISFEGQIREADPTDWDAIEEISRSAFYNYPGHYHADDRLDQELCNDLYVDWARRSCRSREMADAVLVASRGSGIDGFMTTRITGDEGEAVIGGVAAASRGLGVYGALLEHCRRWLSERSVSVMYVRTQIDNTTVQKTWCRLGFVPHVSHHTFHQWFDSPEGTGNRSQLL